MSGKTSADYADDYTEPELRARLKEEIQSGGLGERAVEGRRGQAAELRQKVELYEGLLNVGLSELKKACEEAELAGAAATLLRSAAGFA